jgi:hypothetical protein
VRARLLEAVGVMSDDDVSPKETIALTDESMTPACPRPDDLDALTDG